MRRAVTPHERLSVTLRFLATGRSYEDLKFSAAISPQALGVIIAKNLCSSLWGAEQRLSQSKSNFLTVACKYLKQHTTTSDVKQKTETQLCLFRFSFLQRKVNGYM